MSETQPLMLVALCAAIYVMSMIFIFAGNSPARLAKWAWKYKSEALGQFTYKNPVFWFPLGMCAAGLLHWSVGLLCLIPIAILGCVGGPHDPVDLNALPPRVRLPD